MSERIYLGQQHPIFGKIWLIEIAWLYDEIEFNCFSTDPYSMVAVYEPKAVYLPYFLQDKYWDIRINDEYCESFAVC